MGTSTQINQTSQTTSNIGAAQAPYYNTLMQGAQGLLNTEMPVYDQDRVIDFTPQQTAIQNQILGMQQAGQFGTATNVASQAGLGALNYGQYTPGTFNAGNVNGTYSPSTFSFSNVNTNYNPTSFNAERVTAGQYNAPSMTAAQTDYRPDLNYFQMEGPGSFLQSGMAQQYMSPYLQQALDPQLREAMLDAKRTQLMEDLGAARQGTYGGSRQLLAGMERERNLGQNLGDIRARGYQSAFENAQQQFNTEQNARMQVGQTNLQAKLGVQQLGTQTGLQVALANLDAASQARVQNLAAQLQTQGLNAEQALRAALANQQYSLEAQRLGDMSRQFGGELGLRASLANQQAGLEAQRMGEQSRQFGGDLGLRASLANQQADMEAQRLAEQSRQFGSDQGLQALAQANQSAQTLANIGAADQNADLQLLQAQQSTAAQEQALDQQMRDLDYQDFLRESDYPYLQYQRYANLLSAVPQATSVSTSSSSPAPSLAQQIMGTGLAGLSAYNMLKSPA